MIASPKVREAFDRDREPDRLRDAYGRNEYGESFLLVESGVKVVSVIWMYIMSNGGVANVWDNHVGTPGLGGVSGYAMLKEIYCLPPLDRGLAGSRRCWKICTIVDCSTGRSWLWRASSDARRKLTPNRAAITGALHKRHYLLAEASAVGHYMVRWIRSRPTPPTTPFRPTTSSPRFTTRWAWSPTRCSATAKTATGSATAVRHWR